MQKQKQKSQSGTNIIFIADDASIEQKSFNRNVWNDRGRICSRDSSASRPGTLSASKEWDSIPKRIWTRHNIQYKLSVIDSLFVAVIWVSANSRTPTRIRRWWRRTVWAQFRALVSYPYWLELRASQEEEFEELIPLGSIIIIIIIIATMLSNTLRTLLCQRYIPWQTVHCITTGSGPNIAAAAAAAAAVCMYYLFKRSTLCLRQCAVCVPSCKHTQTSIKGRGEYTTTITITSS